MIQLIKFSNEWLISYIEQIPEATLGDPDCVLKYPYQIEGKCLGSWPQYSEEREVIVRSSDITVITDPKQFYLDLYNELVREEKNFISPQPSNPIDIEEE
jgi:hypothetical protein